MSCEHKDRGQGEVSSSQRILKIVTKPPEAERGRIDCPSQTLEGINSADTF